MLGGAALTSSSEAAGSRVGETRRQAALGQDRGGGHASDSQRPRSLDLVVCAPFAVLFHQLQCPAGPCWTISTPKCHGPCTRSGVYVSSLLSSETRAVSSLFFHFLLKETAPWPSACAPASVGAKAPSRPGHALLHCPQGCQGQLPFSSAP